MKLWVWPSSKHQRPSGWRLLAVVALTLVCLLAFAFYRWSRTEFCLVFLLQNSDEVRATGGFLGSLLTVTTRGAHATTYQFSDVYDLDAQIATFPSAPVGVRTYLTGGLDQLHLPDANWERDFPGSAAQISDLLARAGQSRPDLIVAVNSPLLEKLLKKELQLNIP